MTLYAQAAGGVVYHIVPWTLSQRFETGWPPALCRFRPKRWADSTIDPQGTPVCGACARRAPSE